MDNIKPGIATLIKTLASDDPADVYKFLKIKRGDSREISFY